jgi:hypothetical protein
VGFSGRSERRPAPIPVLLAGDAGAATSFAMIAESAFSAG